MSAVHGGIEGSTVELNMEAARACHRMHSSQGWKLGCLQLGMRLRTAVCQLQLLLRRQWGEEEVHILIPDLQQQAQDASMPTEMLTSVRKHNMRPQCNKGFDQPYTCQLLLTLRQALLKEMEGWPDFSSTTNFSPGPAWHRRLQQTIGTDDRSQPTR